MGDHDDPVWFADEPIGGEADDVLGREAFVAAVVELLGQVAAQEKSSVFGLIGSWGVGKSSLLQALTRQLRTASVETGSWIVTEFNPWMFSDAGSLQVGFFTQLSSVAKSGFSGRKLRNAIADFGRSVAPFGAFGALAGVDVSSSLNAVSEMIRGGSSTEKLKAAVGRELRVVKRPVLVVIDDVDRLDPTELLLLFKLIRLAGRLPNVHYVLAYDEETLLDALGRTGLIGNDTPRRAVEYLEKIVQIRLDVPPLRGEQVSAWVDRETEELAARHSIELTDEQRNRFSRAYFGYLRRRLHTPRAIKRFFAQADAFLARVRGEVDFVDFLVLSWLRASEPRLCAALLENRGRLLGEVDTWIFNFDKKRDVAADHEFWQEVFRASGVEKSRWLGVADLVGQLFPRFAHEWSDEAHSYPSRDMGAGRIANPDYFDRFFAFAVPEEDLADALVAQAWKQIADGEDGPERRTVEEAWPARINLVLSKLQTIVASSDADRALEWLVDHYKEVPETASLADPRWRVMGWGRELYAGLSGDDALELVTRMCSSVDPSELRFLARCAWSDEVLSRIKAGGVDAENLRAARRVLVDRIEASFEREGTASPLSYPDDVWPLFWSWRELDETSLRRWVTAHLDSGSWAPLDLAARMVGTSTAMGVSNPTPKLSDLDVEVVKSLIGASRVLKAHRSDILRSRPVRERELVVTDENRRAVALAALRSLIDTGDE